MNNECVRTHKETYRSILKLFQDTYLQELKKKNCSIIADICEWTFRIGSNNSLVSDKLLIAQSRVKFQFTIYDVGADVCSVSVPPAKP